MKLKELQDAMIAAMKAKDKFRKDAISALVSAVKKKGIDNGCRDNIPDEMANEAILKEIKSVKEQIDTCPADRTELLEEYKKRYEIMSEFAPKMLSAEEVKSILEEKFAEVLATKNKGQIMKAVMGELKGKADGKPAVYADAVKSDGASMLTELICWSDYYDSIVSPFYSYNTGLTADTGRDVMVPCVDMNGDGLLEIPTDAKLKGLPTQVRGVDWCKYKSSVLVHTGYSLAVQEDGYQMVLPDKQFKSVTVSYADKSHRLTVKSKTDKKTAFEVLPVLQTQYDANPGDYKDYTELLREGGYVYLAKCGNSAAFAVTADTLKDWIITF
jgi:uncharacterized protein YqeY